ncbi:MAG: FlgD immunoglobulin-like domain containing protein [Candidatus Fermentibacter sp.]|nr:FlgD immunoglobulin-like domain containing protein [Candidatus Fermentibacter sp.]
MANHIARWDGSSWSALGYGVDNNGVCTIAVNGSDVYAGGRFTQAGGNPADYVARWEPDTTGIEPFPEMESSALHASPNPKASGIELSFRSTGPSPLKLDIFDAAGHLVRTQELGTLPMGSQAHYWDGLDGNGSALAQGVYFLRLSSADLEATTRLVLVR